MAIKDITTETYYKILYNESYIQNNSIYTRLRMYLNESQRIKEKIREEKQIIFFKNLQHKLSEFAIPTGINDDETIEEELSIYHKYANIGHFFGINYGHNILEYNFEELQPLIDLGLEKEWLTDPIIFSGEMLINCGQFDDCKITHEYLYNKLKLMMSNIIDC